MRKRSLLVLLIFVFILVIIAGMYAVSSRKQSYMSVEDNMDKFANSDEIKSLSSHFKLYDSKIMYFVQSVEWDDNENNGIAEVIFRAPDMEELIQESLTHGKDAHEAVDYIDRKLEEGNYKIKQYSIEMDVVNDNGNMRIVVNEKMLEILNGCIDSILADTLYQEVEDEESY